MADDGVPMMSAHAFPERGEIVSIDGIEADRRRATSYEPHPYALLLPPLTNAEYEALKADIAEHGILYPVIVDDAGLVLDGVHRCRIADELGIDVPVSQMGHTSEERKMHLAVGLNMRRRHLDAGRRRELVCRLHRERGLSVREIASVTGWSKSTVDRDLKASPFEETMGKARAQAAKLRREAVEIEDERLRELVMFIGDVSAVIGDVSAWADAQWKRGNWPPPPEEHVEVSVGMHALAEGLRGFERTFQAAVDRDKQALDDAHEQVTRAVDEHERWERRWRAMSSGERRRDREARREGGKLWTPVPDGTRH
jgi:hypothetical protein